MGPVIAEISRVLGGVLALASFFLLNLGWVIGLAAILMLAVKELLRAYYGRLPVGLTRLAYNLTIIVLLAVFAVALEARLLPLVLP